MLGQSGAKQVLSCFLFLLLSLNCNIVKTNLNHFMNQMFFHPIKVVSDNKTFHSIELLSPDLRLDEHKHINKSKSNSAPR